MRVGGHFTYVTENIQNRNKGPVEVGIRSVPCLITIIKMYRVYKHLAYITCLMNTF